MDFCDFGGFEVCGLACSFCICRFGVFVLVLVFSLVCADSVFGLVFAGLIAF